MRILMVVAAFIMALSTASAARAQWVNSTVEDAFNGDQYMAFTADRHGYGVGFRCRSESDLELFFATPEKATDELVTFAGIAKLAVIVDTSTAIEFATTADKWGDDQLRFNSSDDVVNELLFAAAGAKKRFAITAKMLAENYHSRSFGIAGSRKAMALLIDKCSLKNPATGDGASN